LITVNQKNDGNLFREKRVERAGESRKTTENRDGKGFTETKDGKRQPLEKKQTVSLYAEVSLKGQLGGASVVRKRGAGRMINQG